LALRIPARGGRVIARSVNAGELLWTSIHARIRIGTMTPRIIAIPLLLALVAADCGTFECHDSMPGDEVVLTCGCVHDPIPCFDVPDCLARCPLPPGVTP
jgi:hypothetical protein